MNRLAFLSPILCLVLGASPVIARPVAQFTATQAQSILDRLAQEPLRYEGASGFPLGFRQMPGYEGRQPTRVLIGYHVEGTKISGEFIALDADNHPLQAASLSGQMQSGEPAAPTGEPNGYRLAGRPAGPVPCAMDIALATPLHLDGQCAPSMISGAYAEAVEPSPLMAIIPGLGATGSASGQYMMRPWRG